MRLFEESMARDLTALRRCYSSEFGMRMFNDEYLTPPVARFLREEQEVLSTIVRNPESRIGHLVEAGCGYGRLAIAAREHGVKYDGLDIVRSWTGESCLDLHEHARVHRGAIEDLSELSSRMVCRPSHESLVVLPFNLIGNLLNPSYTLERLRILGVAVLVVSFGPEEEVTCLRREYYRGCGFTALKVQVSDRGTRIVGRESLDSTAYTPGFLKSVARERGYDVRQEIPLTSGFALLMQPHRARASFISPSCVHESKSSIPCEL